MSTDTPFQQGYGGNVDALSRLLNEEITARLEEPKNPAEYMTIFTGAITATLFYRFGDGRFVKSLMPLVLEQSYEIVDVIEAKLTEVIRESQEPSAGGEAGLQGKEDS